MDSHLEVFSLLKLLKILGNFCFSEQVFHRKQPLGAPEQCQILFLTYYLQVGKPKHSRRMIEIETNRPFV